MSYMSEEAYLEEIEERTRPPQTMDQDHRDWHVVHGPAEKAGCPWDACLDPSWYEEPYVVSFVKAPKTEPEAAKVDDEEVPF